MKHTLSTKLFGLLTLSALALGSAQAFASDTAKDKAEAEKTVNGAVTVLKNFAADPNMTWYREHVVKAKAVLIIPTLVKAGFIFGGSGGRAVVVAHDAKSGRWASPAFYTLATASVGFQAGIAASENITLVMTQKGLNTLLAPSVKLGGDASVAAGPVGAGAASDVTTDFVAFARSKGVYGGVNLDGTVISVNNDWNTAYYGKSVLPPDVLVRGSASNKGAAKLLGAVAKAAGSK